MQAFHRSRFFERPFDRSPRSLYAPSAWLPNRHLMTIAANLVRFPVTLGIVRERWELSDGDFLDIDRTFADRKAAPIVVVCHGFEGSSRSGYVLGTLAHAAAHGFSTAVLNFRGCSGEPNRLLRQYHSGDTRDLAHVIDTLIAEEPERCIGIIGFSLGGNVVTKYFGERGTNVESNVKAGAVVSVPFDLAACCDALDVWAPFPLLYRMQFLQSLIPKALSKAKRFPGAIDVDRVRRARTIREYDDAVTAPIHGFAGVDDYYARNSSGPFIPHVRKPLLVISAEDDPFVPGECIPRGALAANSHVTSRVSPAGGHVGFISGPPWGPWRWAEEQSVAFLAEYLTRCAFFSSRPTRP